MSPLSPPAWLSNTKVSAAAAATILTNIRRLRFNIDMRTFVAAQLFFPSVTHTSGTFIPQSAGQFFSHNKRLEGANFYDTLVCAPYAVRNCFGQAISHE